MKLQLFNILTAVPMMFCLALLMIGILSHTLLPELSVYNNATEWTDDSYRGRLGFRIVYSA